MAEPMGSREGYTPSAVGTNAALALAKLCYEMLLTDGAKSKVASDSKKGNLKKQKITQPNI
ncbi:glycerol dehydrogenase [Paenibacillus polymyxa]|uniref:glycerol dehydrogenase n=1 Tax=Paenibacillus polymyxa TaxID=1406 RepID=UPI001CE28A10